MHKLANAVLWLHNVLVESFGIGVSASEKAGGVSLGHADRVGAWVLFDPLGNIKNVAVNGNPEVIGVNVANGARSVGSELLQGKGSGLTARSIDALP